MTNTDHIDDEINGNPANPMQPDPMTDAEAEEWRQGLKHLWGEKD